jgi:hypothetical protein
MNTPWKTARRERLGGKSLLPLELYRTKLAQNLELARRLSAGNRSAICPARGLDPRPAGGVSEHLGTSAGASAGIAAPCIRNEIFWPLPQRNQVFYRNEEWPAPLESLKSEINQAIDWKQVRPFGYTPL